MSEPNIPAPVELKSSEEKIPRPSREAPPVSHFKERTLSELRLPLFLIFVGCAAASGIFDLSPLLVFSAVSLLGGGIALFMERALMMELLRWKCIHTATAPFIGIVMYGTVDVGLQLMADSMLKSGALASEDGLPLLFTWLLTLRASAGEFGSLPAGIAFASLWAVGQEFFFRGLVMTRLMLYVTHSVAAIGSAALFALMYLLILGPLAAILALLAGIVFGLLTLASRSLVPSLLCHFSVLLLAYWIQPNLGVWLVS